MSSNGKLIIYGMGGSTCTQSVIMTAIENGADFELKLVDLRKGEHKQPTHLARQPFGQVPTLSEETSPDFMIYESRAIARYINDTRGQKLIPKESKKRALMEQWISLEQGTITPEVAGIVSERVFVPLFGLGQPNESKINLHLDRSKQGLDILDAHLGKKNMTYLVGDEFTLADIFLMPYFNLLLQTPEKNILEGRPHIASWWKRVTQRPSWQKTQSYNEFAAAATATNQKKQ